MRTFLVETGNKGQNRDRLINCLVNIVDFAADHFVPCGPYTFIERLEITQNEGKELRKLLEGQGIRVFVIEAKSEYGGTIEFSYNPNQKKYPHRRNGLEILRWCVEYQNADTQRGLKKSQAT